MNTNRITGFSVHAGALLQQSMAAAEWEARMLAKLRDMEQRGIVKHDGQDGWLVLDQQKYYDEMGLYGPGAVE